MGWCEKRDQIRENCKKTCVCEMQNAKPTKPSCERSQYGCCDDKITVKTDKKGKECPGAVSVFFYCLKQKQFLQNLM